MKDDLRKYHIWNSSLRNLRVERDKIFPWRVWESRTSSGSFPCLLHQLSLSPFKCVSELIVYSPRSSIHALQREGWMVRMVSRTRGTTKKTQDEDIMMSMQQLSQLSSVLESCEWITFAREASEGTRSERRAWEPTTVWVNREERKEHRWDRRGFVPIQTHTQLLIGHRIFLLHSKVSCFPDNERETPSLYSTKTSLLSGERETRKIQGEERTETTDQRTHKETKKRRRFPTKITRNERTFAAHATFVTFHWTSQETCSLPLYFIPRRENSPLKMNEFSSSLSKKKVCNV